MSLTDQIKAEARRLGFERVGIVPAGPALTHGYYRDWLAEGYAGEMAYLHRHAVPKAHATGLLSSARSVICLALNYRPPEPAGNAAAGAALRGRVSRYAWGGDYHDLLHERLERLAAFIETHAGGTVHRRGAVDSAPFMEREWAVRAGLGWVGKNAMLIDWELGSYLFLAELLTDLVLDYDEPPAAPRSAGREPRRDRGAENGGGAPALAVADLGLRESCGSCTACIDACPTEAIVADKTVDARRCISYLTIELKGPIPADLREGVGDWIFGCDVCQEVCPWNRHTPETREAAFLGNSSRAVPALPELLALDESGFRERFRGTPIWRTRRRGLLRNTAIALGNAAPTATPASAVTAIGALATALGDAEPVVRGAAAWALGRYGGTAAREALAGALATDTDPAVQAEAKLALAASPASGGPGAVTPHRGAALVD
ncbi:MAG: DUF1730 domain-containing protein [SAR324 cluster bacterium]|nr:DUF1730 domain-containing protein [SAR324 cluster bacterium]